MQIIGIKWNCILKTNITEDLYNKINFCKQPGNNLKSFQTSLQKYSTYILTIVPKYLNLS